MSNWPKLCFRCGEKDPEKLIEQKFGWSQIISQTKSSTSTTTTSVGMVAHVNICQKCRIIGIARWWISFIVSLGLFGASGAWTFGAFSDGPELVGLTVLAPATFYVIYLVLARRIVSRFYAHFYHSSGYIRGFFRNKEYKEAFEATLPSGIYVRK